MGRIANLEAEIDRLEAEVEAYRQVAIKISATPPRMGYVTSVCDFCKQDHEHCFQYCFSYIGFWIKENLIAEQLAKIERRRG